MLSSLVNIKHASKACVEKINTRLPARVYFFNLCFWLMFYVNSTAQHKLWLSGCYNKVNLITSAKKTECKESLRRYVVSFHWLSHASNICHHSLTAGPRAMLRSLVKQSKYTDNAIHAQWLRHNHQLQPRETHKNICFLFTPRKNIFFYFLNSHLD